MRAGKIIAGVAVTALASAGIIATASAASAQTIEGCFVTEPVYGVAWTSENRVLVDEGQPEAWLVNGDFSQSSKDGSAAWTAGPDGLSISTTESGHRKVAGYIPVVGDFDLSDAHDFALNYTATSGVAPGGNLTVDLDNNGVLDGNLVIESTVYGNIWWLSGNWEHGGTWTYMPGAPAVSGGGGYPNQGTPENWTEAFPNAKVKAVGFSLGSGVTGSGVLHGITVGGEVWSFVTHQAAESPTFEWQAGESGQGATVPADTEDTRYTVTGEVQIGEEEVEVPCEEEPIVVVPGVIIDDQCGWENDTYEPVEVDGIEYRLHQNDEDFLLAQPDPGYVLDTDGTGFEPVGDAAGAALFDLAATFTDEPCPVTPAPASNTTTNGLAATGSGDMSIMLPIGAALAVALGALAVVFGIRARRQHQD